jgi:uncharacterized protein YjbI with pentapeptide repeats
MAGRILRLPGTVLVIAAALVTPVLATSTPASADMVVDGCTIVSNPSSTNFTECPNTNFAGANLSSVNFSYADLAGAQFVLCPGTCPVSLDANLSSANFSYANLSGAQFVACTPPGQCASASVQGANLTKANLSNTTLAECVFIDFFACGAADFTDDVMAGANLSFANVQNGIMVSADLAGANLTATNLGGADLGLANLSGSNLTEAGLSSEVPPLGQTVYVSLNGANVTGTLLVPSDQNGTATSQAGAVATWSTPPAIPGATPGSCTPASGSTFPLFTSTVTCQVLDHANEVATGTFQVSVQPTTQYFTRVLLPSDGASLAGSRQYLDAAAGDSPGVTKVVFEMSGGTLSNQVIATATPTIYGWLAQWNTTTVSNGTYTLQSVATDADNNTDTSTPITITVNNQPPVTAVLIPSNGATLSGTTSLDASASNATSVEFRLFGGIYGYAAPVICTATPTYYGWLCNWNTTTVPNGSYTLLSEPSNSVGTVFSSGVNVTVNNPVTVSFAGSSVFTYPSESVGVNLNQSSTNTVKVDFTSAGGPAAQLYWGAWTGAASSFSPSSGTVTFAPGQSTATIPLTVNPTTVTGCDTTTPCYPSVTITLTNPLNAVLGSTTVTNVFYAP